MTYRVATADLIEALIETCSNSLVEYRDAAGLTQDTEVMEPVLTSIMVVPLHRKLRTFCDSQRYYTKIAKAFGVDITDQRVITLIGGKTVDLVFADDQHCPYAIVELKIADENRPPYAILDDIEKLRTFKHGLGSRDPVLPLTTIAAVVLTDLKTGVQLDERRPELEKRSRLRWTWGHRQEAKSGLWYWQIGVAEVTMP